MYPQLFNQAARYAPMLSRLLARGGTFASPFWKASQIETPSVTPSTGPAPSSYPSPPISGPQTPTPAPSRPNIPALGGLGLFPAANVTPMNWLQGAQMGPKPAAPAPITTPVASPAATPQQPASVPMPQARPAEAPLSNPDMTFWQRNAAMMRDPGTNDFIDPTAASQAQQSQVRGPDLINKMLAYLHNKDIG